jgi:hypothetical protein
MIKVGTVKKKQCEYCGSKTHCFASGGGCPQQKKILNDLSIPAPKFVQSAANAAHPVTAGAPQPGSDKPKQSEKERSGSRGRKEKREKRPKTTEAALGAAVADLQAQVLGARDAARDALEPRISRVEKIMNQKAEDHEIQDLTLDLNEDHEHPVTQPADVRSVGQTYLLRILDPITRLMPEATARFILSTALGSAVGVFTFITTVNLLSHARLFQMAWRASNLIPDFIRGPVPLESITNLGLPPPIPQFPQGMIKMSSLMKLAIVVVFFYSAFKAGLKTFQFVLNTMRTFVFVKHLMRAKRYTFLPGAPIPRPLVDARADASSLADIKHTDPLIRLVRVSPSSIVLHPRYEGRHHFAAVALRTFRQFCDFSLDEDTRPAAPCACADPRFEITDCQCDEVHHTIIEEENSQDVYVSLELVSQLLTGKKQNPRLSASELETEFLSSISRCHTVNLSRFENIYSRITINTVYLAIAITKHNARVFEIMDPLPHTNDPPMNPRL